MSKPKDKLTYYSLQSFVSYFKLYRWRFLPPAICFAISNLCLAVIPYFIGKLIGSLAGAHPDTHAGLIYVIILIAASSLHDLTWRVSELTYMRFVNPLSFQYETLVFRHIINKPYEYFVDKFTGKLSSYVSTLSTELKSLLEALYWNYISDLVTLVTITAILLSVNIQTGLIFIAAILLMFVTGRPAIRRSNRAEKIFTDVQSTKNSHIIDTVANFVNVKSFQTELKETLAIGRDQSKTLDSNRRSFLWGVVFWGLMSLFVRQIIWPITIGLNFYLFVHHRLSIGEFTTLLSTVLVFSNYIWEVVWNVSQFNLRLARVEEAYTYLFGHENIVTASIEERAIKSVSFKRSLKLNDLSFAYPDSPTKDVLRGINLHIKHGEKVGIVGKSGSGKSTITKLLLGYYEPAPGTLSVDDQAVSGRALASLISFVPQDTSLFHRSIADNIAYAAERSVTRQEIVTAAKRAHADEFIDQVKDQYDALVGERGVKLSAGQRQRIAIARAYLDDKPILVMDEATSALDSESEVLIQQALEALWHDKTVIAIAHRLSTLRNMDRIVVMDAGIIVEQGSHQALLKKKGTYAKLWAHQSGGFITE